MKKLILFTFIFFAACNTHTNILEEKPLVVVVPSYKNASWYKRNLDSVFMQQYENYRVIYIDDNSTDGTYELVNAYIKSCHQEHRVTLIHNEKRKGALANHWKAVHLCDDHEIVINLDGDDWLAHDQVFNVINKVYDNPRVWLTYGSYENYPSGTKGECSRKLPRTIIKYQAYREFAYMTSHLRTFYAGLFKQIRLADLIYKGRFFPAACDVALMFPMLEMAGGRLKFIDEVLYEYNKVNPESHLRKRVLTQMHMAHVLRGRCKYKPLQKLSTSKEIKGQYADIIIFSENPSALVVLLESIDACISEIGVIYVLYQKNNKNELYKKIYILFPHVNFTVIENHNLKPNLTSLLQKANDYILFAKDVCIATDTIDLSVCTALLKKTHAYGFYFSLGKNIVHHKQLSRNQKQPPALELEDGVYTWKFKNSEFDWKNVHNVGMTLYAKQTLVPLINDLDFYSCDTFISAIKQCGYNGENIGLFYKHSKASIRICPADSKQFFDELHGEFLRFVGIENNAIMVK